MSIYTDKGYKSREDYLNSIAADYDVDINLVLIAATMLGDKQDFDRLVSTVRILPKFPEEGEYNVL